MQKPPPQPPVFGENIAGRLFDVVRTLQKNRQQAAGVRPPSPLTEKVTQGQDVMTALIQKKENEQKQNAAPAPGAFQKEGSEEGGRQRNVGQGKTQSSFR